MIGKKYKYYNSDKILTLIKTNGYIYYFECGHWCTDNVFIDLIDLQHNRFNYEILPGKQLTIEI